MLPIEANEELLHAVQGRIQGQVGRVAPNPSIERTSPGKPAAASHFKRYAPEIEMSAIVEDWFGKGFAELHPLLQRLHREGGVLSGPVDISFGQGLAGVLGKRLASRMGVPTAAGTHHLQVTIRSEAGILHWNRSFNGRSEFNSRFQPFGHYPTGHWVERSGRLSLVVGVEIRDGGWYWQHRKTSFFGIPIPSALFPDTLAYKAIEGELYRFSVEVSAPVLGKLLGYSGTLAPNPSIERTSPGKPGLASHVKR